MNLTAVESLRAPFFLLSPISLLPGVIQRSNKIIMDDRQPIFGRQSVLLPNFFVDENIVHYLLNFVATWNPPLSLYYLPTNLETSVADFIYYRRLAESQLNADL